MYMESTHSRNVGIAKFVNDCLYDSKNPQQLLNENIRNTVNGFPCLMYINDELQGVYNFNLDRYSTKSYGYTDPEKVLVYEISANSDTTAGAFYSWTENSGKDELSYYKSDFECVYPPTRAAGNDNMSELKRLIEWVDKSSDEDFKDNIGRYFNLEYLLRYYLNVLIFGMVDSLGKNAKITSFDGGLTWYFQFYDMDTSCGLNNSGFLLFGTDIEMGDENVFNTTGSRLWQRVVLLFQNELKEQYALMRQDRFTVDNIMKYLYDEQIARIPATYYNQDMQRKYLDFGSSYLYALHGSGEKHLKKWIRERIMYVDTLMGYMVSSSDYITLRSNKLGYVYLDIEMYIPMYVTVKWRDEAMNAGIQTKRVGRGERVRFEYTMPTATDQEILVYAGHYIKSLGDISNLQPSTLLIANADRLTELECHSPNLINTDLSECKMLQKIDISDCSILGTGIGAQPILNIQNCKYLRYLNCSNTQLTAIYTMQSGSNLEEIYYPETIQTVDLMNQAYLRVIGIPYEVNENGALVSYASNLADVKLESCKNVEYLQYPYTEGDYVNLQSIKQVQNLTLVDSLDKLDSIEFNGFGKLKTLTLSTMHHLNRLGFNDMLRMEETTTLESIVVSDCPLIEKVSFNISDAGHKVEFVEGAVIDLGGMQSVKTIESNASIKGLKTMILPTSVKELKFIPGFGDGINDIRNLWSSTANHGADGFTGMDLLDISLSYLDMNQLTRITNAINFHIAPTTQHPNMNTSRTKDFFKPQGSIDLSNYTGDISYMLKGVDLSLLEVIVNNNQSQEDLTGLFESAIIPEAEIVNGILDNYVMSTNWSDLFRKANLGFEPSEIIMPEESYRIMNLSGMYRESNISEDMVIPSNVSDVSNMFRDCKNLKTYIENWNNEYPEVITTDCYFGSGGNLDFVPVEWGGYGFFENVTSEIVVRIPRAEYELTVSNSYKGTSHGIINWGDGNVDRAADSGYRHVFEYPGIYTIRGHFTFGLGYISNTTLNSTMIEVRQIASDTKDLSQAFKYCTNLNKVNLNNLAPTNMTETFRDCSALVEVNMDGIDTSNVISMSSLFAGCSALTTLDLSNFNTKNVNNMTSLFNGCKSLIELDLSSFDTSKVIFMANMFYGCRALTSVNLSSFNTSNTSLMSYMFYNCDALTELNLSKFNTSEVSSFDSMFYGCKSLTVLNLNNFTTEKVTDMKFMFYGCSGLTNIFLNKFNTSNVTNMNSMFYGCKGLIVLDLNHFDTTKVTDMGRMFYGCSGLTTLGINNFNTTNVKTMTSMFYECTKLTSIPVSTFNTTNVTDMSFMFYRCTKLKELDLTNFDTSNVTNMNSMFFENLVLTKLIIPFNTTKVYNMNSMFYNCPLLNELNVSTFDTSNVTTMSNMFYKCAKVTELDLSNFNTSKVTNMSGMFYSCEKLISLNVSSFNTSAVTDMSGMFNRCEVLPTLDITNFNTGLVKNMNSMFFNCKKLVELDLSSFDTSSVTNMGYMFNSCSELTDLNISSFVTSNVSDMAYLFYNCTKLTDLNLRHFNTSKVTTLSGMFYNCTSLVNVDVSSFNTENVTNMSSMFNGCKSIAKLELDGFVTDKVTNLQSMFTGCYCNIYFTNKNTENVTTVFAMINIFYGDTIDLTGMTLKNSTNNGSFITYAPNLVNLIPPTDICSDIYITAESLSVDSLLMLIDNLSEVAKPKVLEIGSTNINKLSDEQIAVAINKNWTVC